MSDLEQIVVDALPDGWQIKPFGDFCDFMGGTQPPKSTFVYESQKGYTRLLQIRDFEDDSNATYIPDNGRMRKIGADDISIARYGASVGRILTGKEGAINVAIMTTFPDTSLVDKRFLFFALNHRSFYRYLTGLGGRAAQAGFNKGEVTRFRFPLPPLPPLPEQKKIAHILSTVQRAIEAQERIIQTTTELKKALMHKLFTEGLRNERQKQTEIGPIPESWEVVEIGDVFKFTSGKTKPKDTSREPTAEQTIPVYGGNGVLGYSAESLLDDEVLILGRVGEYCGCAHLTARISWVTDNALYAKVEKKPVNRTYIRTHFEHLNLNQYSNKMGQPLITQGIIDRVKFGLPPREEQDELAHAFETLDTRIGQIKAKRDLLQDLFRTLLHELMTAKTRVALININSQ